MYSQKNKELLVNRPVPVKRYAEFIYKKKLTLFILAALIIIAAVFAINAGSMKLNLLQVIKTIIGMGNDVSDVVIWRIRLPRIIAAITAGAGLSVAGCAMQNNLKNPLASPSTLGIASAAAFGANIAIIMFGAGSIGSSGANSVIINNPYVVALFAFISSLSAAIIILLMAKFRGFSPEAIILSGVALSSLFSAGITLIQYFAEDIQIVAAVFWTFGDLGRAAWKEVIILSIIVLIAFIYFIFKRWDYNALDSGDETAKGLGVNVENVRMTGMFVSSLITAVAVSFLGIIGFIGLVGPQMMRRLIGNDHRYLIPASALAGSFLLLVSDTLARTMISPVVLPVGAITSFFGAPVFLYLLAKGYGKK